MLDFQNFVILIIMDDYDVSLVVVMLWVIRLFCFVTRHMCLVLLIFLNYILFFCVSKVFCVMM